MLPIWSMGVRVPIATAWNEVPATTGGVCVVALFNLTDGDSIWEIPADAPWSPSPFYAYTLQRKAGAPAWSSADMHVRLGITWPS